MVFSAEEEENGAAMGNGNGNDNGSGEGSERVKPPLHNFTLPCLKWGTQRHLRCQKVPDNDDGSSQREMVSSPENAMNRMSSLRIDGEDDGINAMRERLMLDLKVEARRMKDAILKKEKENGGGGGDVGEGSAAAREKSWNFRTRKGVVGESGKGLKIDEKKPNGSPLRNGSGGGKFKGGGGGGSPENKVKFSLSLTKKEIEEDFIKMTGQKPPRRPKRRPKNVQKQMDNLYPGMWLSEVDANSYKVPDVPENGKR